MSKCFFGKDHKTCDEKCKALDKNNKCELIAVVIVFKKILHLVSKAIEKELK